MAEITALGATLLHSLWQATLLALLLWSISRYGTLGAAARYRVAYGMLLLQLALSVVTFLHYYTPAPHLESSVKQVVIAFVGFHPAEGPTYNRFTDPDFWMTALVGCWMVAMVVGSVRLGTSFWRVRRMLRVQTVRRLQASDAYAALELRATQLATRLGYRGQLHIRIGCSITTPMLVGHLKPVLLFPLALINQLSTQEAETVILHELAHLQRYDHYFNLLQCLIEVLYYYHPAVHWIGARVREEREYCCDDLVLEYGPGKLPYARALLHYGEQAGSQPATALSLTDGGGLLARVRRFIDHQELKYTMNNRLLLLPLLALLCLIATAAYAPLADEGGEEETMLPATLVAPAGPALVDTIPPEVLEELDSLRLIAERLRKQEKGIQENLRQFLKDRRENGTYPEGWSFDFSPDSLHQLALKSLKSVNMDSIMDLTQLRVQTMELSADSLQRVARSLALVNFDSVLSAAQLNVSPFEFEFDTVIYMHPLDSFSGFRFDDDLPSLEREERRLREQLRQLEERKAELLNSGDE